MEPVPRQCSLCFLGPFSFSSLPILAPRDQYLDFIGTYSEAQAGQTTGLQFLTPEFATTSEHFDYGEYGVVTFLNEENFSADEDDAFSYCVPDTFQIYAFRTPFLQDGGGDLLQELCKEGKLPDELCELAALGLLPIELLPDWHNQFGEDRYELGLFWDFPFLARMEYETVNAGSSYNIPPGHLPEVIGDIPCVMVEFSQSTAAVVKEMKD